ncbi:MAG: heavy metal-associated domain-containing protein [Candidatus Brocadiales bacterium]
MVMAGLNSFICPPSAYAAKKIQLNIKGMDSYSSTIKVKEALKGVKGVRKVYVDFKNEKAVVTVRKSTDAEALVGAVRKAGFRAYLAEKVEKKKKKKAEGDAYEDFEVDEIVGK